MSKNETRAALGASRHADQDWWLLLLLASCTQLTTTAKACRVHMGQRGDVSEQQGCEAQTPQEQTRSACLAKKTEPERGRRG